MVLAMSILLRLPAFMPDFFLSGESLYLVCAQKITGPDTLYADAWFAGPPVMVWIYSLFSIVFGDWALGAIRIFTTFYLYLTVVYFMGMLVEYKVFKRDQWAAAFFLVVLVCTPWYSLELSPALFMIWPLTYSFHVILQLTVGQRHNYRKLFVSGLVLQLCFFAYYPTICFILGILVAYFFFRKPSMDEVFTWLLGFLGGLILFLLKLYFSSSTIEFFQIATYWYMGNPGVREGFGPIFSLGAISLSWAPIFLLSIFGFVHFRLRYFSYVILIRRVERAMVIWLVCGAAVLLLSFKDLQMSDFLTVAPPVAFYASRAWYFRIQPFFRTVLVVFLLVVPVFLYLNLGGIRFPGAFSFMEKSLEFPIFKGDALISEKALSEYFDSQPPEASIWVLDDRPGLYPYLKRECANKYIDYRLISRKFPYAKGISGTNPKKASPEADRNIFMEFRKSPPEYILDRYN
jgi:hypothetical protein